MRRALAPLLTLAALAAPAHAGPPSAPATLEVSGSANSVTEVTLDRTVRLDSGGSDVAMTTSGHSWSGVVIASRTAPPTAFNVATSGLYFGIQAPASTRCPGDTCAWTAGIEPTVMGTDDGEGSVVLHRGRYLVALLGPTGQTVHARITLHGARAGRLVLRAGRLPGVSPVSSFGTGAPAPGHQTHVDGFGWVPPSQHWSVAATYPLYALKPAGTIGWSYCLTVGPKPDEPEVPPCADGRGEDVGSAPMVSWSAHGVPAGTVDIGSGAAAVWGPAGGENQFGAGTVADATAPTSWLDVAFVGLGF